MFFSKKKKNKGMLLAASTAVIAQSMLPVVASAETPKQQQSLAESLEAEARKYIGLAYVWGGTTPAGFDCSGLTQFVFAKHSIKLPRTAAEQYRVGEPVDKQNLQKGDLVFFTTYKPGASHVGIYLGNNKFIDANNSGLGISNLNDAYWQQRYLGAKRIFNETAAGISYNTSVSKTSMLPSVQTVFELNEDNQTYTVQRGNSILEIASHFDITAEQIVQWNNFESIGTPLKVGQKLLVKKPQLSLTLFDDKAVEEVIQETPSVEEEKSKTDAIKEHLIAKVKSKESTKDEVEQPIIPIEVKETDFLPTKHFSISDDVQQLFEDKSLTRAEVAVALYHLEHVNPSFNKAFSENVKSKSIKDVPNEHWAKEAIDWAIQTGFLKVDEQEQFHSEQPFTVEAADTVMKRLLERYTITETETTLVQEQMNADQEWSLRYFQELTFNIADNLVALEKQTVVTTDESTMKERNEKPSPSEKLASDRMTQYMLNAKSLLSSKN